MSATRPSILDPLFATLDTLPGIGARMSRLFERLLGIEDQLEPRVIDLLWHLPGSLVDRGYRPRIGEAEPGRVATIELTVGAHRPPRPGSRAPYRVDCFDDSSAISLVFFHPRREWLQRALPVGARRWVSGRIEWFGDMPQIVHPDHIVDDEGLRQLASVEPVYPATEGLSSRQIARAVGAALERLPALPEWQDGTWLQRQKWPDFASAIDRLHRPVEMADLLPESPAFQRLAYDELLAGQLALLIVRQQLRKSVGTARQGDGRLRQAILDSLPFRLTAAQEAAIAEILADLAAPERMLRLLQGDVGSGKTVVALIAIAAAIEAGGQAAVMAPTDLLARQHFASLTAMGGPAGLRITLLTGRDKGRERERILAAAEAGEIDILVGTHALFQAGVQFRDLALAVVDEQHRFGVHQRLSLAAKGEAVDMLVMTATPIPRTLLMTHYGDMDATQIAEKPPGRQPVDTRAIALDRLEEVIGAVGRAVDGGAQIYWVCPLVEESEALEIASVEERYASLCKRFGEQVGLLHGRLSAAEKDAVMSRFAAGEIAILVATTVIEVGVDVPNATIMVIEHAERFGLAQLHQLRGRVGRGSGRSRCLMLYKAPLSETARARLAIMRESEDGFRIAEEDLRLRGGGELLGTRQSGMPSFRVARAESHLGLLATARDDARLILETDPQLESRRGKALRLLLYLFRRDEAMRLLRAG